MRRFLVGFVCSALMGTAFGGSLEQGVAQFEAGEYAAAISSFDVVEQEAASGEAVEQAGALSLVSAFKLGDYASVPSQVAAFRAQYPTSGYIDDLSCLAGQAHYELGNYAAARTQLSAFLREYPDASQRLSASYYLAVSCRQVGELDQAEQVLGALPQEAAGDLRLPILLQLAEVQVLNQHLTEASQTYATLLAGPVPEGISYPAHIGAARAAAAQGDYVAGAAVLKSLLATKLTLVQREDTLNEHGQLCHQAERYAEALESFETLLREFPNARMANAVRLDAAKEHYFLGQYAQCQEQVEAFLATNPPAAARADAQDILVRALYYSEDYEALDALLKSAEMTSATSTQIMLLNIGAARAAAARGDYATGTAALKTLLATKLKPSEREDVLSEHGQLCHQAGQFAEAVSSFDALLKEYPASRMANSARFASAKAHYFLSDYARSEQRVREFLATNPPPAERAEAQDILARILYHTHNYSALDVLLTTATLTTATQAEITLLHARSLTFRKDWAGAIAILEPWLATHGSEPDAVPARYLLGRALMEDTPPRQTELGPEETERRLERGRACLNDFLQAAAELESTGQMSSVTNDPAWIDRQRIDAHYYLGRYAETVSLCEAYLAKREVTDRASANVLMMQAIARTRIDPPALATAASDLDRVIALNLDDPILFDHLPTQALVWRTWIAEQQHDTGMMQATLLTLRDQIPDNPARAEALARWASVLPAAGEQSEN